MTQFPMTESRRRILEKIPDYEVRISPLGKRVTVSHQGSIIATTDAALLIQETRHDAAYYLPGEDVDMKLLTSTDLSTYCPFKGHASYWSYGDTPELENFVWSYEAPYPEVMALKGYLSFYMDKVEVTVED